jgi:FlgD Ig-like domain
VRASLTLRILVGAVLILAAAGLSLIEPAPPFRAPRKEAEPPSDWFGIQRAFPGTTINQQAYEQALSWARVERSALKTSATGPVWTQAGPFDVGGRATAVAVAPGGTTVYLGAAAGGVFKSTNAGVNWTPVFDQVLSIGAVALDPANASKVYVGTGESNAATDNYDGAGLFRSNDAGVSWSYLGLQETRRIARVAVDPANASRILVAAMGSQFTTGPDRGLYRSEDGGQTWSKRLFVNDSTGVCDVVFNPAHSETVFCASWERVRRGTYRRTYGPGSGIWRSVDHGTTWTRLSSGLPAPSDNVGRIGLAVAPTRPSTVYAQIVGGPAQGLNGLGFWRSLDGGTTWVQRPGSGFNGIFGGFGWYFGDMRVSPTNPDEIYCLGQNLARSTDGGANFSSITGTAHVDFHALWIDPSNTARLFACSDGGFFWTTNTGASWTRSLDLPTTQFYAGAVDASNPSRLLGGAQDNGTNATNGDPAGWFELSIGGDGFYCLVDPTNPNVVFGEYQNMSGGAGPLRSIDGGASFSAGTGIVSTDRFNWNAPFAMAPSDHNLMLAGSQRVYKSTNNGLSWTPISGDLTTNNQVGNLVYSTITTLAIAASNASYFYAGTDDGRVWRSKNGGSTWDPITAGLTLRWVTRVSPDPANPEVVYVTLSGYNQDDFGAHVYRSTNAGDTWTAIDGNLPDAPATDLIVDPLDSNRLYLATDIGVFTTRDLGATWYPLGVGLPLVPVADLSLHAASRTLVAATHGRSQWKLDLTQLPVAVGGQPPSAKLALRGPAPNPSHGEVRFAVELSRPGRVTATVYDALGRRVTTLLDGRPVGTRATLAWDGRDARGARVPAGAYFLRAAHEDGASITRRFVRLD